MSEHLDQWFDRLRAQPPPTPFAPAEEVRRRGRRRTYRQHAVAATAALAVVGLTATGLGQLPGTSSPTVGALSPAATPTVIDVPHRIDDDWFLTSADLGRGDWRPPSAMQYEEDNPPWLWAETCPGIRLPDYSSLAMRRDLAARLWAKDAPVDRAEELKLSDPDYWLDQLSREPFIVSGGQLWPAAWVMDLFWQAVELFRPGGARQNLADIRAVVEECDPAGADPSGSPMRYQVVRTGFAGDESLLIAETWRGSVSLIAVVRVGEVVTTLRSHGPPPELGRTDPNWLQDLAQVAAARLSIE